MVSQFIGLEKARLLTEVDFDFPEGTHAIGRLDSASEGLLLLTTNKKVTKLLFKSKVPHKRRYLVKVRYNVSEVRWNKSELVLQFKFMVVLIGKQVHVKLNWWKMSASIMLLMKNMNTVHIVGC